MFSRRLTPSTLSATCELRAPFLIIAVRTTPPRSSEMNQRLSHNCNDCRRADVTESRPPPSTLPSTHCSFAVDSRHSLHWSCVVYAGASTRDIDRFTAISSPPSSAAQYAKKTQIRFDSRASHAIVHHATNSSVAIAFPIKQSVSDICEKLNGMDSLILC